VDGGNRDGAGAVLPRAPVPLRAGYGLVLAAIGSRLTVRRDIT
jgi:hypothetical protein